MSPPPVRSKDPAPQALHTGQTGTRLLPQSRERDIFPLPIFPRVVKPPVRLSRRASQRWSRRAKHVDVINDGIATLNFLNGHSFEESHLTTDFPPEPLQQEVLERIEFLSQEAGRLDGDCKPLSAQAALRALLHGRSEYELDTNTSLAAFRMDLVSLPESLDNCPCISSQLGPTDALRLKEELMLRTANEL